MPRHLGDLLHQALHGLGLGVGVAGVVDQDVEPVPGRARDRREEAAHLRAVGDVTDLTARIGLAAPIVRSSARVAAALSAWRSLMATRAPARASVERDLAAEARAGAGDEGDLSVELSHDRASESG